MLLVRRCPLARRRARRLLRRVMRPRCTAQTSVESGVGVLGTPPVLPHGCRQPLEIAHLRARGCVDAVRVFRWRFDSLPF
jgi:hypothetical protein